MKIRINKDVVEFTPEHAAEAAELEALRWAAAPGASEHHTGMAVDIVSASYQ